MANDGKQENMAETTDKELIDDNLFHQIQSLFAFLELSERNDFKPVALCYSYKDYNGKPINVNIQQDA